MSKANITFYKCVQDSQDFGSDDETMVSRVFFTLEIGEERYEDLYANLKQTVGADYETGPIEVGPPQGYDGPFNQEAFRDCAVRYYRSCFGLWATRIGIRKDAKGSRMFNNLFMNEMACEFEISGGS